MKRISLFGIISFLILLASPAMASTVAPDVQFIFNTFSFLINGALVMWMAAGFAMLEAGMVRTKNVGTIMLKNIALFSFSAAMYYLVGYNLMYVDVGSFIGTLGIWSAGESVVEAGGYAAASDWFFQMVFVATAASIVSGTLAERIRVWPFIAFIVVLAALIYPIQGAWIWGGGWLSQLGFSDFAGSTVVHSVGGWAALAGALVLGPRIGKYNENGSVNYLPASNLTLASLGTFILWLGWLGFNGGSQLALGTPEDAIAMANIMVNTTMAACGGIIASMIIHQLRYKRIDLTMVLNGALAGLVSITAGPDLTTPGLALLIGGIGGILVVFAVPMFDKLKVDDVVGAISVHLVAGVWGTLVVGLTNPGATLLIQALGIVSVGGFAFGISLLVWLGIKYAIGIRVPAEVELAGVDKYELGIEAYPEFSMRA